MRVAPGQLKSGNYVVRVKPLEIHGIVIVGPTKVFLLKIFTSFERNVS
jgi:hypothetical protein